MNWNSFEIHSKFSKFLLIFINLFCFLLFSVCFFDCFCDDDDVLGKDARAAQRERKRQKALARAQKRQAKEATTARPAPKAQARVRRRLSLIGPMRARRRANETDSDDDSDPDERKWYTDDDDMLGKDARAAQRERKRQKAAVRAQKRQQARQALADPHAPVEAPALATDEPAPRSG